MDTPTRLVCLVGLIGLSAGEVSAADAVRDQVLQAYGNAAGEQKAALSGKRVTAAARFLRDKTGQVAERSRYELWQTGEFVRFDWLTQEADEPKAVGVKVTYVLNDYYPFAVRAFPGAEYGLIRTDTEKPGGVESRLDSYLVHVRNGYAIEGEPLDRFLRHPSLVCVSVQPQTGPAGAYTVLKAEMRKSPPGGGVAWWIEAEYQTRPTPPTFRLLGYRIGGRRERDKRPVVEAYTNTFDPAASEFVPAGVQLHLIDAATKARPGFLKEEFTLEAVADDDRPRSFFTLSAFGIPEPGETGVRVPWYLQAWAWVAAAAAVVLAAVGVTVRRRRRAS